MVTGSIFLLGLVYVWLAFAETDPSPEPAPPAAAVSADERWLDDREFAISGGRSRRSGDNLLDG